MSISFIGISFLYMRAMPPPLPFSLGFDSALYPEGVISGKVTWSSGLNQVSVMAHRSIDLSVM